MNVKAILKSGLFTGFVCGLAPHGFLSLSFYERYYQFDLSGTVKWVVGIPSFIFFVLALSSVGPSAVYLSKGGVSTKRQAFLTGAATGLVAGLIFYLAVVALANAFYPIVLMLTEGDQVIGADSAESLSRVVRTVIKTTYLVIVINLLFWVLLGGVEGWWYQLIAARRAQRAKKV